MFCYLGNQSTVTQAVLVLTGWMGAHVRVRNSSFSDVSTTRHIYSICWMFELKICSVLALMDELSNLLSLSCSRHQALRCPSFFHTETSLLQGSMVQQD